MDDELKRYVTSKPVIWVPFERAVVAATPKVASTAIRQVVGHRGQVSSDQAQVYTRRIAFIRDPLERMESAFHYFNKRDSWPQVYNARVGHHVVARPTSWEDFVDRVLEEHYWDKHWYPQHELLDGIPTEYHLFEALADVISSLGRAVPRENASGVAKSRPTYRLEELEHFFRADITLRETLKDARRDRTGGEQQLELSI